MSGGHYPHMTITLHFFAPNLTHSRIDYLFMFNFGRHKVARHNIGVKDISDRAVYIDNIVANMYTQYNDKIQKRKQHKP